MITLESVEFETLPLNAEHVWAGHYGNEIFYLENHSSRPLLHHWRTLTGESVVDAFPIEQAKAKLVEYLQLRVLARASSVLKPL